MTILVPIVMFGWLFVAIRLFSSTTPQRASVITVVGGFLLLPMATYKFPGIPAYDKSMAISLALLLGSAFSNKGSQYPVKLKAYDLPMLLLCLFSPFATAFTNGLSLYDGFSEMVKNIFGWGVMYWAGRKYFREPSSLRVLTLGIVIGGLAYVLPILFEIRMSPQLSKILYGFFPHSFFQHMRYGGYRPIVFLKHGLAVSLWMSISATVAFWFWRTKQVERLGQIPMVVIALVLATATVVCKSANGWVYLVLGFATSLYFTKTGSTRLLRWFLIFIFLYLFLRSNNLISIDMIKSFAMNFFSADRVDSLTWRLRQEDLFGAKALLHPYFGWGGYNRGWPIDPETGSVFQMVDSLWVIMFNTNGFLGLTTVFLALGIGPWRILSAYRKPVRDLSKSREAYAVDAIILSMTLVFFLLDNLLNSMGSPVYILTAGALISYSIDAFGQRAARDAAIAEQKVD